MALSTNILSSKTILIVDDKANNLQLLSEYLKNANYKILIAQSGAKAVEIAIKKCPDLILLDVMMPGIDGFEVCRHLKAMQRAHAGKPFVGGHMRLKPLSHKRHRGSASEPSTKAMARSAVQEAIAKTKEIPIIFMTALAEAQHKVQGFELGAVDYLTKPVEEQELLARIKTHLSLADLHQNSVKNAAQRKLLFEISDRIRQSLDLKVILDTATKEIQALLNCDFVGLASLDNQQVTLEAYSSSAEIAIDPLTTLHYEHLCPNADTYKSYLRGQIEISTLEDAFDCLPIGQLPHPQARLIVPILLKNADFTSGFFSASDDTVFTTNTLYGWLIADQYTTHRIWQEDTINLLREISTQLAIAIKQGLLHEQLSQLALLDPLTRVYNRRSFDRQLKREWGRLKRVPAPLSLMMCDVDCFKIYNDVYGHQQGDQCLQQIATAIASALKRPGDVLARYGGEEFVIILPHTPQAGAFKVGEDVRNAVKQLKIPHHNSLVDSVVTVSIGIASTVPETTDNPQLLIEAADLALYQAKERGRDCVAVYPEPISRSKDRLDLKIRWVKRLRQALHQNLFSLYAQPITSLKNDDQRQCFEILLRLTDRADKIILPGVFMDIAERNFLMTDIDTWVVNNLFESLQNCDRAIWDNHRFSINLSGASLNNESFLKFLKQRLNTCPFPADLFCFEITESIAVSDLGKIIKFINSLKEIGCSFALDDFGKGVSSLTYLKNLPVDYLKIDGSFIKELNNNAASKVMVEAINHIAEGIGLKTVAEFVENEAILNSVRELKVDYAQGFHLGRPEALIDVINLERQYYYQPS